MRWGILSYRGVPVLTREDILNKKIQAQAKGDVLSVSAAPSPPKPLSRGVPESIQRCVLCGEPCKVIPCANMPGLELQDCPDCGWHKRKASLAREGLG